MAKMTALPKSSSGGKWFRLKALDEYDGQTAEVRLVGDFTQGFECWGADGKCARFATEADIPSDFRFRVENGKADRPRPFIAGFLVNRTEQDSVQAFAFTQRGICDALTNLSNHKAWGDLEKYDVAITRMKSGDKVAYTVMPGAKEPLPAEAMAAWKKVKDEAVGMAALFSGGDPFQSFDGVPF